MSVKSTLDHIAVVAELLAKVRLKLSYRGITHDYSKMVDPELSMFNKYTPLLAKTEFGSDEYKEYLKEMKPALDHHYKASRHHPEHFENGIKDMNLVDITEMLCDWIAAAKRNKDGDIYKSIDINQKRFDISDELAQILKNTVILLDQ